MKSLQNLIHPVEFPLCGTSFRGFHRAGFSHPNEEGGLFWAGVRALSFRNVSVGKSRRKREEGQACPPSSRSAGLRRGGQSSPADTLLKRPSREPWN
jgi:hypothetical protein